MTIIFVKGHVEIYDSGKFICSADTVKEAEAEIEELEQAS